MKLVQAREHLFCRWDDGKDRFNVEGSGNGGVSYFDDEYYRGWPKPLSQADAASGVYLASLTPMQELWTFLHNRGTCLHASGRLPEARAAFAEAHRLEPRSRNTLLALRTVCAEASPGAMQHALAGGLIEGTTPSIPMNRRSVETPRHGRSAQDLETRGNESPDEGSFAR